MGLGRGKHTQMKVHIIGGGNLGVSIALGLSKFSKNNQVTVTRRNTSSIQYLEKLGVTVSTDNKHKIQEADIIILTIKPYQVNTVLAEILPVILRMLLVDPSEAIDSAAIVPSLKNKFKVLEQTDLGWNILHILLKGISHNFLNEDPETKALITNLLEEEERFVQQESHSDAIFGVYQK
jgi:ketopantoate reductase